MDHVHAHRDDHRDYRGHAHRDAHFGRYHDGVHPYDVQHGNFHPDSQVNILRDDRRDAHCDAHGGVLHDYHDDSHHDAPRDYRGDAHHAVKRDYHGVLRYDRGVDHRDG